MAKSSKSVNGPKVLDPNEWAVAAASKLTGISAPEGLVAQVLRKQADAKKNPAAVALGRLGGLKGGKARAASLSKAERVAIGKKGAKARWDRARIMEEVAKGTPAHLIAKKIGVPLPKIPTKKPAKEKTLVES